MNSGVARLDKRMCLLLIMNKHRLLLCYAEHNLIKLKLFNNWSAQVANSMLECAMRNSKKPLKLAHLWELANKLTLNKTHVIEITKTCIVAFMKGRNYLVVWCREKKKHTRCWKRSFESSPKNVFVNIRKLFMADLLSNGLYEKVTICYIIMIHW